MTQTELDLATRQLRRILEVLEQWRKPDEEGKLQPVAGFQAFSIYKNGRVLAVYQWGCVHFKDLDEFLSRLAEQELHQVVKNANEEHGNNDPSLPYGMVGGS